MKAEQEMNSISASYNQNRIDSLHIDCKLGSSPLHSLRIRLRRLGLADSFGSPVS